MSGHADQDLELRAALAAAWQALSQLAKRRGLDRVAQLAVAVAEALAEPQQEERA
jgi:hypothetical protein